MEAFGKAVVKLRCVILILAIALLIPSAIGMQKTRVNYDVLFYLPKDIETMVGQDLLVKEFGTGAVSMLVAEDQSLSETAAMKAEVEKVDHVKNVVWYDSFMDLSVPVEVLPGKVREAFFNGDATIMFVIYDTTSSQEETMKAVEDIRLVLDEHAYLAGITGITTDTKNLADAEEPVYVGIAVLLAFLIGALTMDTFLAPVIFLLSIGCAILYNLGTNYFLGQVSYITKALASVLQLGVTMDYSIFLWHSFKENQAAMGDDQKAMSTAIEQTIQSVVGSSVTTIAGFVALCFMSFTLGMDIGVVMAKGVVFGVICCVTILPAMILVFDKLIEKTRHRPIIPKLSALPGFVAKHYRGILIAFCLIWIPAVWGYTHTQVYYELDTSLPRDLPSIVANQKLSEDFDMAVTHILLVDSDVEPAKVEAMCGEMKKVDGVKSVLGIDAVLGSQVPRKLLPDKLREELMSEDYQMMVITSSYKTASDEVNAQITQLNEILDRYDKGGMLIGEAPLTKDLISVTAHDFNVVNWVSIGFIFLIIFFVFRSVSLPFLLVVVIEFAIFINMGIPGFTGTRLPFVASIVIGTIQLGSTVDYAILMTSRYQAERRSGRSREESVEIAHRTSIQSILVSAFCFFGATFGVGIYSNISMISSLCILMARGALISMAVVLVVLPAVLMLADPVIVRSSMHFLPDKGEESREAGACGQPYIKSLN